ncbi:peptidoglycan editing factor PgeF [Synechococcus elongatus]|uniref:Purine nucleoside phosphorylase n=2 Tax=Synechococcus elongatus TaxID=32046 RepID=Q31RE1_SYNE7|nr:peptidoglycan editing factor PgeF [Synechococcus elongatus]ABB56378.1 Protein of unknown function DUF152 [Synechococcus elongatus PCC 7942 = FACHB-805]AJD56572.1 hypothetical protein M744_01280 [Synechococcus elongatus UTEX 2973]MBD2588212.1 peptidoglycan editing factor PgeF [Synechococcus elongatus FACHB-242]MBD2689280.1 peptidoglycan editing factor PgeF [Synechococcus elongatus FACHB-1061]MBD2707080.1 peptidoglycan editing factor PgeF [Synechococcus elongatus PCC 7942 = FACHB-805]
MIADANPWFWQATATGTYLRCQLLADFEHGFFTRTFAPAEPHQLQPLLNPQASVHRVKQVHGNKVLPATIAPHSASPLSEADGLYSEAAGQSLWVCSADCTPALVADLKQGSVAAVHAGWRGTAAGVLRIAVQQLLAQGSQPEDLRVALGPAIAGEVYQVEPQVALQTLQSLAPELTDPQAFLTGSTPAVLPDSAADRLRLDVRQVNRHQLLQLGLSDAQISIAPHCTFQDEAHFFSYRRSNQRQVQWSGIVSQAGDRR